MGRCRHGTSLLIVALAPLHALQLGEASRRVLDAFRLLLLLQQLLGGGDGSHIVVCAVVGCIAGRSSLFLEQTTFLDEFALVQETAVVVAC